MYIPFNDSFHKVAGVRRQDGAPASNPFTVGQQAGTQFIPSATNSLGGGASTSAPPANPSPVTTPAQQEPPATTASSTPLAQTTTSTPPAADTSSTASQSFISSTTTDSPASSPTSPASLSSQNSSTSQIYSSSPASSSSTSPSIDATSQDTKAGQVAGGVVGGIAGLAIILAILFIYFKARRNLKRRPASYGSLEPGKWRYSANSRNFKRVIEESNALEAMDQQEKFAYHGVSEPPPPPPPIFAQHTSRGIGGSQDLRMDQEKSWYKKPPQTHARKHSTNYFL